MDCPERRQLLKLFVKSNEEYRQAIARCRVCQTCRAASPEHQTACQLDQYLNKFDQAYESVVKHCDDHGC